QDQKLRREYEEYYNTIDVWVEGGKKYGPGSIVVSHDIISDRELENTEFYRDFIRKTGVFYLIGSVVPVSYEEVGVIGIHRPGASGAYDDRDKCLAAQFLPHLQKALQLRRRLREGGIAAGAGLEGLERGGT